MLCVCLVCCVSCNHKLATFFMFYICIVIFFNDFLPLLAFIELKEHCCVVKTTESYMPEDYIAFSKHRCYVFLKTAELSLALTHTLACRYHR